MCDLLWGNDGIRMPDSSSQSSPIDELAIHTTTVYTTICTTDNTNVNQRIIRPTTNQ